MQQGGQHFPDRHLDAVGLGEGEVDVRTTAGVRCCEGVDQVCDPRRPATFVRVGEDRYRWEFRQSGGDEPVRDLLAPRLPTSYPGDLEIVRQMQYTFRARLADRSREGRVFLLGDAATSPRLSSDRVCARVCATSTTSPGSSPASCGRAVTSDCWTPTRATASPTPAMSSGSRSPWAGR